MGKHMKYFKERQKKLFFLNALLSITVLMLSFAVPYIFKTFSVQHEEALFPNLLETQTFEQALQQENTTTSYYKELLKQEELAQWQALAGLGISFGEFEQCKKEHAQDYEESIESMKKQYASETPLSKEMLSLTYELLKDFNINPATITIISSTLASAGASTDRVLFVNESLLQNYDKTTQKFVIAHECTHMNNKDHSTRYYLKQVCTEKNHNISSWQHPYNKMRHLHEMRADIMPCLKNREYAQGCVQFYSMHIQAQGDYESADQPKSSLRLATATSILNMLQQYA